MLASQRTRLLQRGAAIIAAFDPAEILPAGSVAPPIACAMGPFRQLGRELNPGGFLPDLQLAFRVTRSLFTTAAMGGKLQWRIPGEASYRGTVTIASIIDRPSVPYIVIGCVNPSK